MLAIIGGTGIYDIEGLNIISQKQVSTPYGEPSSPLMIAHYANKEIIFLARHGNNHKLLPSEINYRANIWALKSLGVKQIIGISAMGSLRKDIAPSHFAIPSQYFDFTKGTRSQSFFGDGLVAHVSMAKPVCPALSNAVEQAAKKSNLTIHTNKIYACIEGPRLGTQAESFFLRDAASCDLVGMTNIPEAFLAREAQICYCTIGIITDYDCWLDDTNTHVTVKNIAKTFEDSVKKVKIIIKTLLESDIPEIDDSYRKSLESAMLSSSSMLPKEKKELLQLLME